MTNGAKIRKVDEVRWMHSSTWMPWLFVGPLLVAMGMSPLHQLTSWEWPGIVAQICIVWLIGMVVVLFAANFRRSSKAVVEQDETGRGQGERVAGEPGVGEQAAMERIVGDRGSGGRAVRELGGSVEGASNLAFEKNNDLGAGGAAGTVGTVGMGRTGGTAGPEDAKRG